VVTQIAKLLSVVLGPPWLVVLVVASVYKSNLKPSQINLLLPALLIFEFIIPLLFLYLLIKKKHYSAWDLPIKEERRLILLIFLICSLVSLLVTKIYGNQFLTDLILIFLLLSFAGAVITYYWKISLHMLINTVGALYLNFLFDWKLPYIYVVIPAIFWARYYLKRHTLPQLAGGFLFSVVFVVASLKLLDYI